MAKLVVTTKSLAGLSLELGKQWVTIGRAHTNTFSVPDPSVSGHHCEALMRGDELVVRDMRSTNGTYIRGAVVTEGRIKLGEGFRIGEVDIWFEPSEVPSPLPKLSVMPPAPALLHTDAASAATLQAHKPSAPPKKHQVLLIDDSMAFLETMGETFEAISNRSWEIHRASSADTALFLLQKHAIELAVVDINMPMLDGVQLLRVIQRRHPDVKKVVLTGMPTETNRANSLANGAELFLEKPVTSNGITSVFNLLNDLFVWSQREGFSGTLRQVGLTDVIQIECLRRSSCILEVHNPETHGAIYIECGEIVHATAGTLTGEPALFQLLCMRNGEFRLQPFVPPSGRSILGSWECLLMEAARVCDEESCARANQETVLMTRANLEPMTSTHSGTAEPSPSPAPDPLPDIGEEVVVVSTYDGKWRPVDGLKR